MGYKLSRFNYFKKIDGQLVFFNAKTCALALVDEKFEKVYRDVESGKFDKAHCDKKLLADMVRSGCLVADDMEEIKEFQLNRNIRKFNTDMLRLTITPTLDCNFRCTYCFENHMKGIMTEETQQNVLRFIESKADSIKNLGITWFGGEPLVAKHLIYGLSERIIRLCKAKQIEYNAFMVTNGSLFCEDDAEKFKGANIKRVQVTIDGPPEVHNRRRVFCNGTGTFNCVLNALKLMVANGIDVVVRINVDKENLSGVGGLLDILRNNINDYDKLRLNFAPIRPLTQICKSVESSCIDDNSFASACLNLHKKAVAMGFNNCKDLLYPKQRFNNCSADILNAFVIDTFGNLYKCWNQIGILSQAFGNISDMKRLKVSKMCDWIEWNPLDFEKCKECNLLPVCAGGCQYLARMDTNSNCPKCIQMKYEIDELLKFYVSNLTGRGCSNDEV